MIFRTTDEMAKKLFKQTADIAGRIAASGYGNTSPDHAAKQARRVMTELLGLKSMKFELTQTAFVVNSVEVTIEVKDEYASRGYPDDFGPKTPKPTAQAGRTMASVADGEPAPNAALSAEFNRDAVRRMAPAVNSLKNPSGPPDTKNCHECGLPLCPEFGAGDTGAVVCKNKGCSEFFKLPVERDGSTERAADDPTYLGKARLGRVKMVGHYPVELDGDSDRVPFELTEDPEFDAAARKAIDDAAEQGDVDKGETPSTTFREPGPGLP